jgi:hypothetical protein
MDPYRYVAVVIDESEDRVYFYGVHGELTRAQFDILSHAHEYIDDAYMAAAVLGLPMVAGWRRAAKNFPHNVELQERSNDALAGVPYAISPGRVCEIGVDWPTHPVIVFRIRLPDMPYE